MAKYQNSNDFLKKIQTLIPTGSQTFSKSHYSLPEGTSPLFLRSGNGVEVVDLDDNKYIDLVNGLLCVSLGYQDADVDRSIREQLESGISFSLPHKLEYEVAKLLVDLIPCAEMVRFGKNGTDVTSAAIRVARAYTKKEHVLVCGYHGWQDWFIGSTTRNLGVPISTQDLTHTFNYNDFSSLLDAHKKSEDNVAAIIMEPMNVQFPKDGFLERVRRFATEIGAVLIFDEMITGFRFDTRGAQSLFGVTPDLATFGKGMANGMPLSALVGKSYLMKKMEDIFFSGTFGGETLSLAAAKTVIEKYIENSVPDYLAKVGNDIATGVESIIETLSINWFSLVGHDTWRLFEFKGLSSNDALLYKSVLIELLIERGVLTIGSHNVSYALKPEHVDKIIDAYSESLQIMQKAHLNSSVSSLLRGGPLKPVFKVR